MSDVITCAKLQEADKHNDFYVQVITGKDGGVDIDYATNAVTGQVQKTLPKVISEAEERLDSLGVPVNYPIPDWTPNTVISVFQAYRSPDGDLIFPKVDLPFTTAATFPADAANWGLLQGLGDIDGVITLPQREPTQLGDGVKTVFSVPGSTVYSADSYFVYADGLRTFNFSVLSAGQIEFDTPPALNVKIDTSLFIPLVAAGVVTENARIDLAQFYSIPDGAEIGAIINQAITDGYRNLAVRGDFTINRTTINAVNDLSIHFYGTLTASAAVLPAVDPLLHFVDCEGLDVQGLQLDGNLVHSSGVTFTRCSGNVRNVVVENLTTLVDGLSFTQGIRTISCTDLDLYDCKSNKNYRRTGIGRRVRGYTIDGTLAAPNVNVNFHNCSSTDTEEMVVFGYVKGCKWNGGYLNVSDSATVTSLGNNGFYVVPEDAPYGAGGLVISGAVSRNVLQPFVTRVGGVTYERNIEIDCSLNGLDTSSTSAGVGDLGVWMINNHRFISPENSYASEKNRGWLRTRDGHQTMKNIYIHNNTVHVYAGYGGVILCDKGSIENVNVSGNKFYVHLVDTVAQTSKNMLNIVNGSNLRFVDNEFIAVNSASTTSTWLGRIILPTNVSGLVWENNPLTPSSDGKFFPRLADGLLRSSSRLIDNSSAYTEASDLPELQGSNLAVRRIYGATYPRYGKWNIGDTVINSTRSTQPSLNFWHFLDAGWVCVKSGDFGDASVTNWPVFEALDQQGLKRGVAGKLSLLVSPGENATVGKNFSVNADRNSFTSNVTGLTLRGVKYTLVNRATNATVSSNTVYNDTKFDYSNIPDGSYRLVWQAVPNAGHQLGVASTRDFVVLSSAADIPPVAANPIVIDYSVFPAPSHRDVYKTIRVADGATSYTLNAEDGASCTNKAVIVFNTDAPVFVAVSQSAALSSGFSVMLKNIGSGSITVNSGGFWTIHGDPTLPGSTSNAAKGMLGVMVLGNILQTTRY